MLSPRSYRFWRWVYIFIGSYSLHINNTIRLSQHSMKPHIHESIHFSNMILLNRNFTLTCFFKIVSFLIPSHILNVTVFVGSDYLRVLGLRIHAFTCVPIESPAMKGASFHFRNIFTRCSSQTSPSHHVPNLLPCEHNTNSRRRLYGRPL